MSRAVIPFDGSMKLVATSTLEAYARQFWRREHGKGTLEGLQVSAAIKAGADPVQLLREKHGYKLPVAQNSLVEIVALTGPHEVLNLLIHDYMLGQEWMKQRSLAEPFTQRVGDLAKRALERGYFNSGRDDRQISNYQNWKAAGSLKGCISPDERPLIELREDGAYEIVDGWGRLMPFAALLLEGFPFEPFEVFRASPP